MKRKLLWMLAAILICGLSTTLLTACSSDKDDESGGNGADDLAYLQKRVAAEGGLVYGVQVGTDPKDIVSRPVADQKAALEEFYKLIPGGRDHKGLSSSSDGTITCRLTGADGKPQGAITYQATTAYYCAEVIFSPEAKAATGISRLRYIPIEDWPEESNGFLSDILDKLKG